MKLHEILAVEKGIKSRTYATVTECHKQNQVRDLFFGFSKTFSSLHEDQSGMEVVGQPPQIKNVQAKVSDNLELLAKAQADYFDVVLRKDKTNTVARADVSVDGVDVIKDVPVPFLLFLEKQLTDIVTFISVLPVLDPSVTWEWSDDAGCWVTKPVWTLSTKKVPRPIVLQAPTKEHPAQVHMEYEDVPVGKWETVRFSSALQASEKETLVRRATVLLDAVKQARERANSCSVAPAECGKQIMDFILYKG